MQPLPYLSYHESQQETVVLIHGAFSSLHAFDFVVPRLSKYHLLIPDHTAATKDPRFCLEQLIDSIAELIHKQAKGSRAHVFGFSFGSHLALRVAGHYPDQILSVFASGVNRLPPPSKGLNLSRVFLPFLVYAFESIDRIIPSWVRGSIMGRQVALVEDAQPPTIQQVRNLLAAISTEHKFSPIPARVLLIAAVKTGWLQEEVDSIRDARAVFDEVQPIEGSQCIAHSGLTHCWLEGNVDIFLETLSSIIEGRPIEGEFWDILADGHGD